MDDFLLVLVLCDPPIVVLKAMHVIFSAPPIHFEMKEPSVRVSLSHIPDARALLLPSPLKNGETKDLALETSVQSALLNGELTVLLSYIKLKDDKERRMKEDLRLGEQGPAPLREATAEPLELVEQNVVGLGVRDGGVPRVFDNFVEPRQTEPKVLKTKGSRLERTTIVGEEEGTMVGEGRGERVEHMRSKAEIPLSIAKDGIKLAKGRVLPPVGPREPTVLEVNLVELTSMQSIPETDNATPINIGFVLVSSAVDLVEVTKHEPPNPRRRLLGNKLGKEIILLDSGRRSVDGCYLEITIGVDDMDGGRQAEFGDHDIGDLDDRIVPQQQNTPSGTQGWSLDKATQTISPNEKSIGS